VMLAEVDSTLTLRAAAIAFGERKRTAGVVTTDQRGTGLLLGATYTRSDARAAFSYDQTLRFARWHDNVLGGGGRSTVALAGDLSLSMPLTEDVAASFRGGWQRVIGSDSPVQFRGSLASPGRVRGYPSGVSSGDHYVFGSLQVQALRPIAPRGGGLELFPYAFVDAGRAWDRVAGVTTAQDVLVSAGVGTQLRFGRNGFGDVSIARPLRDANGFSKSRHWQINAQVGITF
jgi:hemolysin activation/secretion protein